LVGKGNKAKSAENQNARTSNLKRDEKGIGENYEIKSTG
jgi:hypothetical protein